MTRRMNEPESRSEQTRYKYHSAMQVKFLSTLFEAFSRLILLVG